MDSSLLQMSIALVISAALTGVLIPKILLISFRKNLFDEPDERKIHTSLVPRLGGLAFMPAIFFTIAALIWLNKIFNIGGIADIFAFDPAAICSGMCAVMLVYLVGIADDLIGVKYRAKFVVQLAAALFLVSSGIWIHDLDGFLGISQMPSFAGIALTVVVVVYIMNAINLIDGIDGLASGLSAIALMLYAVMFWLANMVIYAAVCCAALGTLSQFFYYNVFGDAKVSKKIFMGDTGALTTGLVLGYMSLHVCRLDTLLIGDLAADAFVVAFSPLIIPCFDVLRVFGTRIANHKNPFDPDRTHIHHKLLDCGMVQRTAMLTILAMSLVLTIINIILAQYINITWLVAVDLALVLGVNVLLDRIATHRREVEGDVANHPAAI